MFWPDFDRIFSVPLTWAPFSENLYKKVDGIEVMFENNKIGKKLRTSTIIS